MDKHLYNKGKTINWKKIKFKKNKKNKNVKFKKRKLLKNKGKIVNANINSNLFEKKYWHSLKYELQFS